MRVLALDTAADVCAACVWDAGRDAELGRSVEAMRTGHAERLMAVLTSALEAGGVGFADLSRIVVSVGPGSFTGIRVGVAAARGLSLALKLPAVGVSTLEAIAAEARLTHPGRAVAVLVGSGAGPIAAAVYDPAGAVLRAPQAMTLSDAGALVASLADPVLAGSAAAQVAAGLAARSVAVAGIGATADIAVFAQLGAARTPAEKPVPLYLRPPDAKPQDGTGLPRRA